MIQLNYCVVVFVFLCSHLINSLHSVHCFYKTTQRCNHVGVLKHWPVAVNILEMIGAEMTTITWKFIAKVRKTCYNYRGAVQRWQHIRSLSCLFHRQRGEQQRILLNPRKKIALSLCFKALKQLGRQQAWEYTSFTR